MCLYARWSYAGKRCHASSGGQLGITTICNKVFPSAMVLDMCPSRHEACHRKVGGRICLERFSSPRSDSFHKILRKVFPTMFILVMNHQVIFSTFLDVRGEDLTAICTLDGPEFHGSPHECYPIFMILQ